MSKRGVFGLSFVLLLTSNAPAFALDNGGRAFAGDEGNISVAFADLSTKIL